MRAASYGKFQWAINLKGAQEMGNDDTDLYTYILGAAVVIICFGLGPAGSG